MIQLLSTLEPTWWLLTGRRRSEEVSCNNWDGLFCSTVTTQLSVLFLVLLTIKVPVSLYRLSLLISISYVYTQLFSQFHRCSAGYACSIQNCLKNLILYTRSRKIWAWSWNRSRTNFLLTGLYVLVIPWLREKFVPKLSEKAWDSWLIPLTLQQPWLFQIHWYGCLVSLLFFLARPS